MVSMIKAITKNYSNYEIRLNAYTYAKKHNIVWRTKELMKNLNMKKIIGIPTETNQN